MERINSLKFPKLETERLLLRQLIDEDADTIASLRSDDEVNAYIDRPKELSPGAAKAFITKINQKIKDEHWFYWAVCLKGQQELIGTFCLFNFSVENTCAELGYELNPDYQGRGFASEAIKEVISFAFKTIGFKSLEAVVHQYNLKSVKLLQKNNFVPDINRKHEKYTDYVFFVLTAS